MGGGTAQNPATGETRSHETKVGVAVDQGWQDLKSKVPGELSISSTSVSIHGADAVFFVRNRHQEARGYPRRDKLLRLCDPRKREDKADA
jgi:hypothetical protein